MTHNIRKAIYKGDLQIGNIVIPCAVLEDGTRILSEHGINNTLGSPGGKTYRLREGTKTEGGPLPLFIASKALQPYVDKGFNDKDLAPIEYQDGVNIYTGYAAEILPKVCEVWLQARDEGVLQKQQLPRAAKAEILMRGLAYIGILALVDEVTGYQNVREKDALQKILDKFLKDEAHKWYKTFPDQFWHKLIKIKGYPSYMALKRPSFIGHWVNDIIYDRLAPGISKKLKEINPRTERGIRETKHHQRLTEDYGVPELKLHIEKTMLLMDAAANETEFKRLLNRSMPKYGSTLEMHF